MLPLLFFLRLTMTAAWTFPDGRCYVNDCDTSPYDLTWNSVNLNNKNELVACFDIDDKTCINNNKYNCCNSFKQLLNKVIISTNNKCNKSVVSVTSNGIRKPGGVFFDLYDINGDPNIYSQLRITNLAYTNATKNISDNSICITVASPCNSLESFCNGDCKFALFNSEHTCCPTCSFNIAPSLAPSGFSSPPPPRSPLPPSPPPVSHPPPRFPPPPPNSPPPNSPPPNSPPPNSPPPRSPPPPPNSPPPNSPPPDYPPPDYPPPSPPDTILYPVHTCNRDKICESMKQYCLLLC